MALLCLDLEVTPGELRPLELDGAGPRAHAAVANWVVSGKIPKSTQEDSSGWRAIVDRGPGDNYRQYVLAGTALVLASADVDRPNVIETVGTRIDADRGVDGVPWMLPEGDGAEAGDLLASLAGIYFDLAASQVSVADVLDGTTEHTTFLGTRL